MGKEQPCLVSNRRGRVLFWHNKVNDPTPCYESGVLSKYEKLKLWTLVSSFLLDETSTNLSIRILFQAISWLVNAGGLIRYRCAEGWGIWSVTFRASETHWVGVGSKFDTMIKKLTVYLKTVFIFQKRLFVSYNNLLKYHRQCYCLTLCRL